MSQQAEGERRILSRDIQTVEQVPGTFTQLMLENAWRDDAERLHYLGLIPGFGESVSFSSGFSFDGPRAIRKLRKLTQDAQRRTTSVSSFHFGVLER